MSFWYTWTYHVVHNCAFAQAHVYKHKKLLYALFVAYSHAVLAFEWTTVRPMPLRPLRYVCFTSRHSPTTALPCIRVVSPFTWTPDDNISLHPPAFVTAVLALRQNFAYLVSQPRLPAANNNWSSLLRLKPVFHAFVCPISGCLDSSPSRHEGYSLSGISLAPSRNSVRREQPPRSRLLIVAAVQTP